VPENKQRFKKNKNSKLKSDNNEKSEFWKNQTKSKKHIVEQINEIIYYNAG